MRRERVKGEGECDQTTVANHRLQRYTDASALAPAVERASPAVPRAVLAAEAVDSLAW